MHHFHLVEQMIEKVLLGVERNLLGLSDKQHGLVETRMHLGTK